MSFEPPGIRAKRREPDVLESAVQSVTEQAVKADDLVDEAIATGLGRSRHARRPREDASPRVLEVNRQRGVGWSVPVGDRGGGRLELVAPRTAAAAAFV